MFFSTSAKIKVLETCPCNKVLKIAHAFFFFFPITRDNKAKQSTKQNVILECIIMAYEFYKA